MSTVWLEKLDKEGETELIEKLAGEIHRRRLETPAILFLEMHKPLGNVAAHAMMGFSPMIGPFVGIENLAAYSRLAANRESYERLIERLEEIRIAPEEESNS